NRPKTPISAPFVASGRELNGRPQQSFRLMWQGQLARRPLFPPSELRTNLSRRVRRACRRTLRQLEERTFMPLYEHWFLARQDASSQQVEELTAQIKGVVEQMGGKVSKTESWGVRSLTYRMNKNRKAHFTLLNIDGPAAIVAEIERQERIHEDVIRYLTVRVD